MESEKVVEGEGGESWNYSGEDVKEKCRNKKEEK